MSEKSQGESALLISADSHVIEQPSLWSGLLDPKFWGEFDALHETKGTDPTKRGDEQRIDGVLAEVLYPTLGMSLFSLEDAELQEAGFHAYNAWLAEFCAADPTRLVGIGMIPCYNVDVAIAEIRFCREKGLRGGLVWQTPHPDLPFTSFHYDPIWKVAEELDFPINFHILTGFNYSRTLALTDAPKDPRLEKINRFHSVVNEKIACTADTVCDFIFAGVFDRFPGLKLVIVENELSWAPFYLDQWDYYYGRFRGGPREIEGMTKAPSEYFKDQIFVTFFRDPWAGRLLQSWGETSVMWSNDFPHGNTTWPNSLEVVMGSLGGLEQKIKDRVLRDNCIDLYKLDRELIFS